MKHSPCTYYFLFFLVLLYSVQVKAQQQDIHFYHLNTSDGLSDNSANDICQDHQGFMWFATRNGLNRYDGKHFVVFRHSFYDSNSICNNLILHVAADSLDNIWFITSYSVSCLERRTGKFINYYYKKNDGTIVTTPQLFSALGIFQGNEIIAFSPFYGFFSVDKIHHQLVPKHFSQIPPGIDIIRQSLAPNGWISYKNDSAFYVSADGGNHFKIVLEKKSLPSNILFNSLRLVTVNKSICCFATTDPDKPSTIVAVNIYTGELHTSTVPRKILMAINNYSESNYWIGFWGAGLTSYNSITGKTISYVNDYKNGFALSNDMIRSLFTDKDKNLWIGTEEGIDYCNPEHDNISIINNNVPGFENMHIGSAETIAEDRHGKIWIGMLDYNHNGENGLISFDPATYKYESFPGNIQTWKILPDRDDNILLGTQTGLYQFDQKTKLPSRDFKYHFPYEVTDFKKGITILQKDSKGNFWFGLWRKGLIKFNPATNQSVYFSAFSKQPGLRLDNDLIVELAEDNNNKIWAINWVTNVVECIDNTSNHVTHIPIKINGQILSDRLENIVSDHNGHIWIGTSGAGLIRLDTTGKNIKLFGENDGLPDENIHALAVDNDSRLWVYSSAGLVWIDTKQGFVHAIENNIIKFEDSYNGQTMLMSKEGKLFVTNNKNLFFFRPEEIVPAQQVMPPVLTSLQKMNEVIYTMPLQKEITVFPGEDFVTVNFVSIDMTHSREINYAYRLKGFDKEWQQSGNEGKAVFTKLPPGNYELQLRASLAGMKWDGSYTSVLIKVIPAFYQALWFRIIILLLLLFLLSYIIYYVSTQRLRKKISLMKQQQEIISMRNRIASDIHDDIGAGLTKISIQSELAKQNIHASATDHLTIIENINRQSHELVNSLGEIVWTINPQYDKAESMLAYFRHYIHKFLEGMPLQYHINFPETTDEISVHPDIKRNLFLILKESLHNAVKHAQADELDISFEINEHHYTMQVADNGTGMKIETANIFGNGIKGMQNRASQIHAALKITRLPNGGTSVFAEGDFYQP